MTSPAAPAGASTYQCPACGAIATGKFCSECGAARGQTTCNSCRVGLIETARFCHRCGLPVGAAAPSSERAAGGAFIPWSVAAIALLALIALVAGQQFARNRDAGAAATTVAMQPSGPRAPDISALSPHQRAMRLFDRVMQYSEAGRTDSLRMFAPMAIAAYELLDTLDLDSRYDLGRIGELSGDVAMAAAQADTILRSDQRHLLGLILAAHAARLQNRAAQERQFFQRLIAAAPAERAKRLPEYVTHDNDITAALDEARRIAAR